VLAPVPHRQYVFSLPKLIRPFFRYRSPYFSALCQIVARLLRAGFKAIEPRGQPAFVLYVQTFGDLVTFNPHIHALVAEGRQRLARYMIRCPFALEKMRYDPGSGMVIYRSRLHATLKRNYHIPDKYEHLVRYYGDYSNRSRGARRLAEQAGDTAPSPIIDDKPVDSRRKANWARLIQKVYEVDPLECSLCGGALRIIALIDDGDVIERILRHLDRWDPAPETITSAGPDPPLAETETLPLTYHPVPDIAWTALRGVPCVQTMAGSPGLANIPCMNPPATAIAHPITGNPGKYRSNARRETHYSRRLNSACPEGSIEFPCMFKRA
jgi:hypothetical protein